MRRLIFILTFIIAHAGSSQKNIEMVPNGDFSQYTDYEIPFTVWKEKFNDAVWNEIDKQIYVKDIYGFKYFGIGPSTAGVKIWLKNANSVFLLNSWYPIRSSNRIQLDSMIYQDTFHFFNHNQYENATHREDGAGLFLDFPYRTFSYESNETKVRVCGKNLYPLATPLSFATKKGAYYHLDLDLMYDKNVYLYSLVFKRRLQSAFVDFDKKYPFLCNPKYFERSYEKYEQLNFCNVTLDTNLYSRNNNLKISLLNQYLTDSITSSSVFKEQDVWSMPLFPEVFEEKHFSHLFKANEQLNWLLLKQKPRDSVKYFANDTLPFPRNDDSLFQIITYNGLYSTMPDIHGYRFRFHPFLGHWKWLKEWRYPGKYRRYADKVLRNADYFLDNLSLKPDMYQNGKIAAPSVLCKADTFLAFIPTGEKVVWRDLLTGNILSNADSCWIHLKDSVSIEVIGNGIADTLNYSVRKPNSPFSQSVYRLCLGDSLTFASQNGYETKWQNTAVAKKFVYHFADSKDSIRAMVTSNLGCSYLFTSTIVKGPAKNQFQIDTLLCNQPSLAWSVPSKTWELMPAQNVVQRNDSLIIKTEIDFVKKLQLVDSASGCNITVAANIISRKSPLLGSDIDTVICLQDVLKLNLPKSDWIELDGSATTREPLIQKDGVHVLVAGNLQCEDTLVVKLARFPEIQIAYRQLNPWTCFLDSSLLFQASPEKYQYFWDGSMRASATFETQDSSKLSLLVVDSHGCQKAYQIKPQYSCYKPVWIPNVFTPNADGKNLNETFQPHCISCNTLFMRIYSRWGECIYEGSGPWNGIYMGKPVPDGEYVYIIGVKLYFGSTSEIQYFKGEVQVMR